jgi:hypothetical protein
MLHKLIIFWWQTKLTRALYNKLTTEPQAVQEEIVNIHNTFRRNVFPPARNMLKMVSLNNSTTNDGNNNTNGVYWVIIKFWELSIH